MKKKTTNASSELVATLDDIEKMRYQFFNHRGVRYSVLMLVTVAEDNYPVVDIPISLIEHNLAPEHNGRKDEADGTPQFEERAKAARDFPIVVVTDETGHWVADGRHRLWRAKNEGKATIRGRFVPLAAIPEFVVTER